MNTSSSTINKNVEDIMGVMSTLHDIYKTETQALERMDTKTFLSLQNTKIATAQTYQSAMKELLEHKNELKALPSGIKNKLRTLESEFATLTTKNLDALDRMHRLSDRLSKTIHSAARDVVKSRQYKGYGHSGTISENPRKSLSMGISETV